MSKIVFLLILGCLVVTFVDLSPVCRSVQGVTKDWCCVRGRWYQNGARINFSKLYLCQCSKCVNGVQKTYYNDCECDSKTTTSTTTTTTPTTTPGCTKGDEYEGKDGNWCYGAKCIGGKLVHWDNFNCVETTTETTTTTTTTGTTTSPGCTKDDEYEGKDGNWCYGAKCIDGKLAQWDNFNCVETTKETTTITTMMTTTTPGCTKSDEYEGKNGNWCYGAKCIDGKLVHWDNFNCGETTKETTTTTSTTTTPTSIRTTTPLQCSHEGRNYPPGTWIERTTCGGLYCDENGDLLHYDTKAFFEGADCIPFSETTVKVSSTERNITSTVRPS